MYTRFEDFEIRFTSAIFGRPVSSYAKVTSIYLTTFLPFLVTPATYPALRRQSKIAYLMFECVKTTDSFFIAPAFFNCIIMFAIGSICILCLGSIAIRADFDLP